LKESPSQTAGPYVHIGCTPNATGLPFGAGDLGAQMITGDAQGTRITLTGRVFDGAGDVLRDAMIEVWQADAAGLFPSPLETRGTADPHFTGWGRTAGDMETGVYTFDTVKPGAVPLANGALQAPHITLWITARGINLGLHTRAYFADEVEANAADPILTALPDPARLPTLMAQPQGDGVYLFDVHLQGDAETLFFDM
jgi:protocatechuate 3,4-dioxygenase alpha subunit